MPQFSVVTPCPVPYSPSHAFNDTIDDATTVIDFTTEFRASLRNAKPRRKQTQIMQFAIHEDNNEDQAPSAIVDTSLFRPPRRSKVPRVPFDASNTSTAPKTSSPYLAFTASQAQNRGSSKLSQAPRRSTARLSTIPQGVTSNTTLQLKALPPKALRPLRRETVFVPNDDTTMPSMYMNIFSPIKSLESQPGCSKDPQSQIESAGIGARTAMKRGRHKTMQDSERYRGPLQPSTRPIQETTCIEDRHGQGDGKENIPPGFKKDDILEFPTTQNQYEVSALKGESRKSVANARLSVSTPTASSSLKHRILGGSTADKSHLDPAENKCTRSRGSQLTSIVHKTAKAESPPLSKIDIATVQPRVSARLVAPAVQLDWNPQKYALLPDNITTPALYEDNWIQHQEIAITQLINNLFSSSRLGTGSQHQLSRKHTLALYNTGSNELVYRRLRAALLYGALSVPQDILDHGSRLENDVGMKKRFLDLWLRTYDLAALESALEAIVGRECRPTNLSESTEGHLPPTTSKSGIRNFIETFIIRNEDAKPDQEFKSRTAWSYLRTTLRSLMLIKVLDSTKTEQSRSMPGCLFQHTSSYKSSASVVQALMQMLNPATGDPIRALGHINYVVSHVQCPLEEFDYQIVNLATDLRDGVRLMRLVELLLYPSTLGNSEEKANVDCITPLMLEGNVQQFLDGQAWPLSQYLRMACQSRAVRRWNVELTLSVVKSVKGIGSLIDGITADDIVDGFREKTLRLLWALVGKWGLPQLVDWQDVDWEIRRLQKPHSCPLYLDDPGDELGAQDSPLESCKRRLKQWAGAVASSKGVSIRNFTTSFASGAVFEAIVHEYEKYLFLEHDPIKQKDTLQDRLNKLGCSAQFSTLFAPSSLRNPHVFDQDFVLATLAFLCSRLLAPTRRTRAVTAIQRVWRQHWSKVLERRRQQKRELAAACAELVKSGRVCMEENSRVRDTTLGDLGSASHSYRSGRAESDVVQKSPLTSSSTSVSALMSPAGEDVWLTL